MQMTRRACLVAGVGGWLAGVSEAGEGDEGVLLGTAYLVRHAEKVDESRDPELSEAGVRRAGRLAAMFAQVPLDAIYSTPFRRTRATVRALAGVRQLPIDESVAPEKLAEVILAKHRGQRVLVAGHSNTIPALLVALGSDYSGPALLPGYDELFSVDVLWRGAARVGVRLTVLRMAME